MASDIMRANIEIHTRMAQTYTVSQPHFRPENQAKVQRTLSDLAARCGGGRLLDIGCGTGFIIHLALPFFRKIDGVDITEAMLKQIDINSGKVQLHNTPAERLPFPDGSFDMVSAYSFIHHVEDYRVVLREASRVLRRGGICYIDLEPNKQFWQKMAELSPSEDLPELPRIVKKARDSVTQTDAKVQQQFGIAKEVFNQAEYGKSVLGGIDPQAIYQEFRSLGFSHCSVRYEWFLGQGDVMHGQSPEDAGKIEAYLRSISPLSDHLFKYVQIVFTK
jgi:ubiquinone/menaquinone biosynthesis C-methylase UbiE